MSSRLPIGVGTTVRGILQPPSKYSPEEASRARAAAPRTPDLGPRVATFTSARSRDGGLARRATSLRAAPSINSPASMAPPPTATTSGLKMFTNPARPTPSHLPVSLEDRERHRVPLAGELGYVLAENLASGGEAPEGRVGAFDRELTGAARYGGARGEGLQAAVVAAGAAGSRGLDRHVPELAAGALRPTHQDSRGL